VVQVSWVTGTVEYVQRDSEQRKTVRGAEMTPDVKLEILYNRCLCTIIVHLQKIGHRVKNSFSFPVDGDISNHFIMHVEFFYEISSRGRVQIHAYTTCNIVFVCQKLQTWRLNKAWCL
jgi:hypothetical protein